MTTTASWMARAGAIAAALLCVAVLGAIVVPGFERVRTRVVTSPLAPEGASMDVALEMDDRLSTAPVAVILRVRGAAEPVTLDVTVDGRPLTSATIPAGREVRLDAAIDALSAPRATVTLTASGSGWALTYLEVANIHGYVGRPIELVVVPRSRPREDVWPFWALLTVFALLLAVPPRFDWSRRPARALHRGSTVAAVALFGLALMAPLVSPFAVRLSLPAFLLGVLALYARPLSRLLQRAAVPGLLPGRDDRSVLPLPPFRELLWAGAGLTALVAIVLHEQIRHPYDVPDLGDPLFSIWRITWVLHQLWHDPRHLFDAPIFHPAPATLTYSDAIILPAITALPLLQLGAHPLLAYNVVLLSGFVFSGVTTYLLARALGSSRTGAWASGVVFVVYPYRFEHYPHLELQMAQWMPLALLGTHRFMATRRPRWAVVAAAAIGAQWYSSMYYALFLSIYVAVFALALAWVWRERRGLAIMAAAVLAGAILALPLALTYAEAAAARGERPIDAVRTFSATPADYLQPHARSAVYGELRPRGAPERELFPGIAPVALAAVGAAPPWTPARLAVLAGGLTAFDGSLGLNGLLYPSLHDWLSPVRSVRVPARFAILVGLTLALLSGAGVDRFRARVRLSPYLLGAIMTAVIVAEAWPSVRLVPVWREPPAIYETLGASSGAVLMEYPMSPVPEFFHENLPFMYFSAWHFTPMVNGYSGFIPESYAELARAMEGFPGGDTLAYLQRTGVTHISVVCAIDGPVGFAGQRSADPERCQRTIRQLDADARVRALLRTTWQGAPAVLYALGR